MSRFLTAIQQPLFNTTSATLKNKSTQFEVLYTSQEIRSRLSTQAFVLVLLVAIVYAWGLWDRAQPDLLLAWSVAVTLTAAHRAWYCRGLLRSLKQSTASQLIRHESYLFFNGVCYGILIGSAFWLIAANGDDRTVFAITLMSCMYAIGTTVNSSLHFRTFAIFTLLNLGQGIAFFAIDSHKVDIPIMMTMIVITILLLRFGHRNAELFEKSVTRRLENLEQNKQLKKSQSEIERSLQIATEASLSKSRFLAAAGHDLRQPLQALTLFLGSLKNTDPSDEQIELLDYMQQSADTLTMQFNSLLDLSQYDSGKVTPSIVNFDLHTMLARMVNSMSIEAAEKKLSLTYLGEPGTLQSDPILIDRVMRNLISNALKYTESGSVRVAAKPTSNNIVVSVSDTGCGIAPADQQKIFEEFTQINNPERGKIKGAGLGLAIVSRITRLLNIPVNVESQLGVGSTFTLTIPLEISNANSGAIEALPELQDTAYNDADNELAHGQSETVDLSGLRVLLVDDDKTILMAFQQLLTQQGADVVACRSYDEAIAIRSPTTIDCAFIDDMLAGSGSGLDIANWLAGYANKHCIMLVTGSEKPQRIQQIRLEGFSVYTKPLTATLLNSIFLSKSKLFRAPTLPQG